jgi:electron transport complex protein RnfC
MDHPSVLTPGLFGVPPPPDVAVLGAGTLLAAGRALATGRPCLDTHVTVSGPGVASPRNLRVRLGTPVRDCIAACGGYTAESVRLIAGGVLRGASLVSDHAAVFHETAGITVLTGPEPSGASEMPCILCGRCLHCCPAGLFPHELDEAVSGAPSRAERLGLSACLLCGCCAFICPSRRRITERLARAKLARPPGGDG